MPLKTLSNSTSLLRCAGRGEDRSISSPQHFKLGSTEAVGLERKHPLENEDVNQGKENNQWMATLPIQPTLQVTKA